MHVQSLSSIVNNPKRKGIFQKAKDLYLHQTGRKIAFKTITEEKVEDSTQIPKVNPSKDFRSYLRSINEAGAVSEYLLNHPVSSAEEQKAVADSDQPFSVSKDASSSRSSGRARKSSSVDSVAESLRRSSTSQSIVDFSMLPPHYFESDFLLPASNFTI